MHMMQNPAFFSAVAALSLAACGNGSNTDRHSEPTRQTAYSQSAFDAGDASVARLSATWFDGFVVRGRSDPRVKATPEEVDAYLSGRGRGASSMAVSHITITAAGR